MLKHTIAESAKVVEALAPAADAAGRNGDFISLKNGHRLVVICQVLQGNAATVTLTLEQAQDVAGTGAKAAPVGLVHSNLDTAAADTLVRRTDAAAYTTDAAIKNKIVIFEVDVAQLDSGFDCVRVKTGASNAANITAAIYLMQQRYGGLGSPSAITD